MKKIVVLALGAILISTLFISQALARENVDYWYIKDFQSEIIVNADSSLDITEKITADCGNGVAKHGIFRVLPTETKSTEKDVIKTPITLLSITDFNNQPRRYSSSKSQIDHTVTWKIGDPDVEVTGVNYYKIHYRVDNAIRFGSESFDELYWNLNGNFWDLETDSFSAKITFPDSINKTNTGLSLYTGSFGNQNQDAVATWSSKNVLEVRSIKPLAAGEGITLSAAFEKGIFTPYIPSFLEKYGRYFSFLIPILTLIITFALWAKFGRDPKIGGPVVPEFEVPGKFTPMELGEIISNGNLKSEYISAGIINLAVGGFLKIEQTDKNDYKLIKIKEPGEKTTGGEKLLLTKLFSGKETVTLKGLKNQFYTEIEAIEDEVKIDLAKESLVKTSGTCLRIAFIAIGVAMIVGAGVSFSYEPLLGISFILADVILTIFAFIIPKRTVEAVRMLKKIEGFKLYMKTAEKYRQQFNEKENIFEKFLPYAMVFGLTGLWIKKMKELYGEKYFTSYHPVWFYGAGISSFDADSFNASISSLSSHMSSTLASSPSSSGAGGGGFSGGGGGGGGGGGW